MAYIYRHIRIDTNMPFYIGISNTNDEYKRAYLLGVCYYLKEVKKWDWNKKGCPAGYARRTMINLRTTGKHY
jgi:hypothetical protein